MRLLVAFSTLTLLGLAGMHTPAEAQSQAGGLPAVSARVQVLEGIATTLLTQVTTLQTQVTTLQTANTDLQSALATESAARTAADAALTTALTTERNTRRDADIQLASLILDLQGKVDAIADQGTFHSTSFVGGNLVNGAFAILATLALPPGNYLVIGRVSVENEDHNTTWLTSLRGGPTGFIDFAESSTINSSLSSGGSNTTITMAGTVTLTAAETIGLGCQNAQATPGSVFRNGRLLAVRVGSPG